MDASLVTLIGFVIAFVSSVITLFFNRRGNKADTLGKLESIIDKVQERADKLYDEKVACEVMSEKLRGDLAIALVENATLKEQLAEKIGYIQGITDPLMKLEAEQKAALKGGRRSTDVKTGEHQT
jgi:hypothetical protein